MAIDRHFRILFIDHTGSLGGGEIALLNLATHLDPRRYTPVVLLCAHGPLYERLLGAGVESYLLPLAGSVANVRKDTLGFGTLLRLKEVVRSLQYVWRLRDFIRSHKIALVHTNSLKADLLGGVAARLAGVPLIWHIRDRIDNDYLPRAVVHVFRRLCQLLPHYIIANSAATLETIKLAKKEFGEAIPSGIDNRSRVVYDGTIELATVPEVRSSKRRLRRIGLVGRISPWKGQHVFINAAAKVRQRFTDVRFQIIGAALFGEQEYERKIRDQVKRLELEDCVEFTGHRNDVAELVEQLDMLVHASTTAEPFGQVIIEGMAAGKPVVATAGGGVLEIVVDGVTGLLVPMGDADAMAQAITRLLEEPSGARRMGDLGRQRVREYFTIENTAYKVERVYDNVLAHFGKAARNGHRNKRATFTSLLQPWPLAMAMVLSAGAFTGVTGLRSVFKEHTPLTALFIAAVAISARFWGTNAGLAATAASVLGLAYVLPPGNSLAVYREDRPILITFMLVSLLLTRLIGMLRTAETNANKARLEVERAHQELAFIARASAAFAVSPELDSVLRNVAYLATSKMCDICVVDLVAGQSDADSRRAFAIHRVPSKHGVARRLCEDDAFGTSVAKLVSKVVRARTPAHLHSLFEELEFDLADQDGSSLGMKPELGPTLVVPLNSGSATLGAVTLVRSAHGKPFSVDEMKFISEFAWRAALALSNAVLIDGMNNARCEQVSFATSSSLCSQ
jgi:glycosyltransferase involved in cell wall biosynthesis